MKRVPAVFSIVLVLVAGVLWAKEASRDQKRNPRLLSMAPLGGHPGSSLEFRLRGEDLEGIRSVWLDCDRLTAEVKAVKEIVLEKAKFSAKNYSPGQEVSIRVDIAGDAAAGAHSLRLLTEWGLVGAGDVYGQRPGGRSRTAGTPSQPRQRSVAGAARQPQRQDPAERRGGLLRLRGA